MPLVRPKASSLSIPIPAAGLWRLQRPSTPRRATYPLSLHNDIPPVPALSFWDPETPSPLPSGMPSMSSASARVTLQTSSSSQQMSAVSSSTTPSSYYSQTRESTMGSEQAVVTDLPAESRLDLPLPSLYPVISPYSPTSPCSPHFPRSPISPTSPHSPHNPFLPPLQPRLTTTLFRLAAPLLPASPLSIFDRAISPTSPTFLLSGTPSPGTPNQEFTFLRTATPSMIECNIWEGMSPTFLYPRTPPAIPHRTMSSEHYSDDGSAGVMQGFSSAVPSLAGPSASLKPNRIESEEMGTQRKEMKIEFFHFLATKRAAAMKRLSGSTSAWVKSEKKRGVMVWEKLLPRGKA